MALFKCKMCGGDLEIAEGVSIAECEYCGTKQTVPKSMDENLHNLFNRANTLRIKSEFDKAEKLYEKIIQADSTQSEAYWGLILCKYGIEYVDDPSTYKKIPTCHRASYDSIIADDDYKSALENADMSQRAIYEEQAKEIDRIQKDILALAQKEETYDVFICYKETDANGQRTQDSVIANDIYYQLTNEGFKVFYAAITLEGKLGSAYEPIIFAALNSAKVMLAIGTKPEYYNAVWVKNEWSRFLNIIKKDRSKLLIPCYRDMDAYELPEEFAHLQAQDMAKIGFINDLVRGIKKVVKKDEPKQTVVKETVVKETVSAGATNTAPLLKRAFLFLEDADWKNANEYCEKVLDIDPENAQAYLGKLMAELKVKKQEDLKNCAKPFDNSNNYQKVLCFADEKLKAELGSYLAQTRIHQDQTRIEVKKRAKQIKKIALITIPVICVISIFLVVLFTVIIPSVKYNSYISNGEYGAAVCMKNLTEFTIPDGVTSIGDSAFEGCTVLTNITIPDSVTSIGNNAFRGCTGLTSITIPDSVTNIGNGAFSDCTGLTSITLPFVGNTKDGTKNTHFGYIFGADNYDDNDDCVPELLNTVVITSGTSIGDYAFESCTNLTNITITDSVISIGNYAFRGCAGLTSITIPDSVTSIGNSAFSYCKGFTSITIPDSVTIIGSNAFYNCTGLTSITLPFVGNTKDGTKNTHFGYIFGAGNYDNNDECIPELLQTVVITGGTIGDNAFRGCDSLTSITIPDTVTGFGDSAFAFCDGLTSITIPNSVTSIGSSAFRGCASLTNITIPNGVTSIDNSTFSDCKGLTSITISDSVTSIGLSAFRGCSKLTNITFEGTMAKWNTIYLAEGWNYKVPATEVVCSDGTITIS